MSEHLDPAYLARSESCSLFLDATGICLWASPEDGAPDRVVNLAKRCVGAQYVASLDGAIEGCLAHQPEVGKHVLFAMMEEGRIAVFRFGPLVAFEDLAQKRAAVPAESAPAAASAPAAPTSDPKLDDPSPVVTQRITMRLGSYAPVVPASAPPTVDAAMSLPPTVAVPPQTDIGNILEIDDDDHDSVRELPAATVAHPVLFGPPLPAAPMPFTAPLHTAPMSAATRRLLPEAPSSDPVLTTASFKCVSAPMLSVVRKPEPDSVPDLLECVRQAEVRASIVAEAPNGGIRHDEAWVFGQPAAHDDAQTRATVIASEESIFDRLIADPDGRADDSDETVNDPNRGGARRSGFVIRRVRPASDDILLRAIANLVTDAEAHLNEGDDPTRPFTRVIGSGSEVADPDAGHGEMFPRRYAP